MSRDRAFAPQELVGELVETKGQKKKERRKSGGGRGGGGARGTRGAQEKRARSRRDARKRCAMPRERESRRKHRREFRYSRRTAAAVVASRRVCATSESMRPRAYMRARAPCVRAYMRSSRPGLAVRERNSLPELRYLEEPPFLLAVARRHPRVVSDVFARVANVCVSRCDRSGGRARARTIYTGSIREVLVQNFADGREYTREDLNTASADRGSLAASLFYDS